MWNLLSLVLIPSISLSFNFIDPLGTKIQFNHTLIIYSLFLITLPFVKKVILKSFYISNGILKEILTGSSVLYVLSSWEYLDLNYRLEVIIEIHGMHPPNKWIYGQWFIFTSVIFIFLIFDRYFASEIKPWERADSKYFTYLIWLGIVTPFPSIVRTYE